MYKKLLILHTMLIIKIKLIKSNSNIVDKVKKQEYNKFTTATHKEYIKLHTSIIVSN